MYDLGLIRFQSLSGFQVRCNLLGKGSRTLGEVRFQSLSGFQVRCNAMWRYEVGTERRCFNPYRVFKFVATIPGDVDRMELRHVSIPIGFSSSLQRKDRMLLSQVAMSFQSLSGFQVRCNLFSFFSFSSAAKSFQSLSGFQVRCNTSSSTGLSGSRQVSIPIGFSSSLQPPKSLATWNSSTPFQSLSGFQVRCNCNSDTNSKQRYSVSIPIGFSSSLQLHRTPRHTE